MVRHTSGRVIWEQRLIGWLTNWNSFWGAWNVVGRREAISLGLRKVDQDTADRTQASMVSMVDMTMGRCRVVVLHGAGRRAARPGCRLRCGSDLRMPAEPCRNAWKKLVSDSSNWSSG